MAIDRFHKFRGKVAKIDASFCSKLASMSIQSATILRNFGGHNFRPRFHLRHCVGETYVRGRYFLGSKNQVSMMIIESIGAIF